MGKWSHPKNDGWTDVDGRSRGHDSGDNGQSFEARYRPPFSAAGNRRCLQVLRIPKALWQGLPRTLRSPLSTAGCLGAGGGDRTRTGVSPPRDFKSVVAVLPKRIETLA